MPVSNRAMATLKQTFFSSPSFAVVGASKDSTKFGTKILEWYKSRGLNITPIHPKESELGGVKTVASVADLPNPKGTSISIVTPPKVTLGILKQVKELSIPAVWLQPGTDDDDVRAYIKDNGLSDIVISGGACVLVDGDSARSSL